MAVPKRKVTPSKRNMRRAHDRLSSPSFYLDKDTQGPVRPHHLNPETGMYRGRQVMAKAPETEEDEDDS